MGTEDMQENLAIDYCPEINTKCLQFDFSVISIPLSLKQNWKAIVGTSCAVSYTESRYVTSILYLYVTKWKLCDYFFTTQRTTLIDVLQVSSLLLQTCVGSRSSDFFLQSV